MEVEDVDEDSGGRRRSNRRITRLRSPYSPTRSPPRPSKRKRSQTIPAPPRLTPEQCSPPPTLAKTAAPKPVRKQIKCPSCPYTVTSQSDLSKHIVHHGRDKQYKCSYCNFSSELVQSVKRHEHVHTKNYKQDEQTAAANDHPLDDPPQIKQEPDASPPPKPKRKVTRKCADCPFKTQMADLFRTHIEGHKRVTGYKCPQCSFRAAFYGMLVKHIPLHETKNGAKSATASPEKGGIRKPLKLLCSDCNFTSSNAERLETHRLGHDMDFKGVFECSTCFFQTLNWEEFDAHDKKHEDAELPPTLSPSVGGPPALTPSGTPKKRPKRVRSPIETKIVKGNKVYLCPKCPYYGKRATDLRKHVRHHGVHASHQCPFCDYASNSQHAVSIHTKLHPQHAAKSGLVAVKKEVVDPLAPPQLERESGRGRVSPKASVFSCTKCPARFHKKRQLDVHRKQHTVTDGRPGLRCLCGYAASHRLVLICHYRSAHGDAQYAYKTRQKQAALYKNMKKKHHYCCFPCQIRFKQSGALFSHKYRLHKRPTRPKTEEAWAKRLQLRLQMPTLVNMRQPQPAAVPTLTKPGRTNLKKCPECPYRTPQTSELKKHAVRHSCDEPIKCPSCTFSCATRISLAHHRKVHITPANECDDGPVDGKEGSRSYFKCNECPYTTRFPYDLGNHKKRHDGDGEYACTYCTYKAQRKGHIRKHQLLHTDANAIQRAAGAKTNSAAPTAFEKRIRGKDGEIVGTLMSGDCYRVYSCISCPFRTPLNSSLMAHSRLHVGERIFKCTQCSFNTEVQRRLTDHIKVHNNNYPQVVGGDMEGAKTSGWAPRIRSPYSKSGSMYKCDYCPHTTKAYTGLWYHLQKHKKTGKYKCKQCSFATSSIACMRRHDSVHLDGDRDEDVDIDNDDVKEEKPNSKAEPNIKPGPQCWNCPHCPFVTHSHGSYCHHLKMHRRKAGTKEYSCPHCSFNTSARTTYQKHMVLHDTPEMQYINKEQGNSSVSSKKVTISAPKVTAAAKPDNPLQCVQCPHVAQSKQLLTFHKKLHKGRRPYKCPHCTFSVQHEASLKTHLILHAPGVSGRHRSDRILSAVIKRAAANHLMTYSSKYPTSITVESTKRAPSRVQCPLCPYRTRNPDRLVIHHNEKHMGGEAKVENGCASNGSNSPATAPPTTSSADNNKPDGIVYYCSKCSFRTEHQGNLLKHTSMHGAKDNTFMCSVCDYSCKQIRVVRFHEQNHHKYVPFTLLFSDKVATTSASGQSEGRTRGYVNGLAEPRAKAPLHCTLCPFTTVGLSGLMQHWKQHEHNDAQAETAKCNIFLAGLSLLPRPNYSHKDNDVQNSKTAGAEEPAKNEETSETDISETVVSSDCNDS